MGTLGGGASYDRDNALGELHDLMTRGTLVLVVGPSGAGKDMLLRGARRALAGQWGYDFPAREITRPADAGGEAHLAITEADFAARQARGAYCLAWRAHGLGYGLPRAIEDGLAAGRTIVVNGSRAAVPEARARFTPLRIVHVTAPAHVIAQRLRGRGRESEEEIGARLRRATALAVEGPDVITLMNVAPPNQAIAGFVDLLTRLTRDRPALGAGRTRTG